MKVARNEFGINVLIFPSPVTANISNVRNTVNVKEMSGPIKLIFSEPYSAQGEGGHSGRAHST